MPPFIPAYQSLGLRSGWKFRRHEAPFPLSHHRIRTYYLGRNAVYHGAKALGLAPGDEVLFPSYHSGTESAPLFHLGCRLKFYGVSRGLEIDLAEIEAKISPATRAIYAIHFIGFPAPIEALRQLADRHGLPLIEDVALGLLGKIGGRPLGTWGDISIFCLYKTLPVAAGGVLAINRPDVPLPPAATKTNFYSEANLTAKHVLNDLELNGGRAGRWLRRHLHVAGKSAVRAARAEVRHPDSLDFNPDLLDWQIGPITRSLLRFFDYESIVERRRANYEWLVTALAGESVRLVRPTLPEGASPLFLPILVEDKFGTVARLNAEGIEAIPFWGIHHAHLMSGEFPDTEFLVNHAIEIPIHQSVSLIHLRRIRDAIVQWACWEAAPEGAAAEVSPGRFVERST